MAFNRDDIARKAAALVSPGMVVNLGIGIPTLVANHLEGRDVMIHSENGLLGMGPFPYEGEEDPQLINAGKQTVTVVAGGSTFDSALSFGMIRGGHVDIAMLGAMEISVTGDLANWQVPGEKITGMGGAMDLAAGAREVLCLTTHTDKRGKPKLVEKCSLPLTAAACVRRVITDLGSFRITSDDEGPCFVLEECAPDVTVEEIRQKTSARVEVSG